MTDDTPKTARKRQARGQKRITELLDAAAEVFAEQGFKSASTNAIAARAGASPGTLYQFFKNKEAIAEALMARYVERLKQAHTVAFRVAVAKLPLDEMLNRVVDPLIAFDRENPAFYMLLADPHVSPEMANAKKPAQKLMFERLDRLLRARVPELPDTKRTRTAEVAVHIFRGLLPMIMSASEQELPEITAETKRALHAYLSPVIGAEEKPGLITVTVEDILASRDEGREERMQALEEALQTTREGSPDFSSFDETAE